MLSSEETKQESPIEQPHGVKPAIKLLKKQTTCNVVMSNLNKEDHLNGPEYMPPMNRTYSLTNQDDIADDVQESQHHYNENKHHALVYNKYNNHSYGNHMSTLKEHAVLHRSEEVENLNLTDQQLQEIDFDRNLNSFDSKFSHLKRTTELENLNKIAADD